MTKRQKVILEALKDCRQNLNSIKNLLGTSDDKTLIEFLKAERKIEYDDYKLWCNRAKNELNCYNVSTDFKDKVEKLLPIKSKDTTLNYMM